METEMHNERAVRYLPADSVVAQRIETAYPTLSAALRSFADFVLSEPMKVAQMSINDTVHASGVSVATANRFARKLGFEGYAQFRSEVIRSFEAVLAPVERLRAQVSSGGSAADVLTAALEEDVDNLRTTLAHLDRERLEQAVEMIVAARRIFVVGFDNAAALGFIFAQRMTIAGKDVETVANGSGRLGAARTLARLGPEDLVLAIAFPRYMRDTVETVQAAARHGVPILAVTDSQASPLAGPAQLSLYLRARRSIGSTSDTAILSFLEALAAAAAARLPGATEASETFAAVGYPWLIAP